MSPAIDLVRKLNDDARRMGVADSIVQFDNVATQAQYSLPYAITARFVGPDTRVLDWGCGNGHFSLLLESLGADVTGYSFEPPPAALARSNRFRFVAGSEADPRSLPFADESFDVVAGVGVLEHVWETGGDELSSLRELYRVLAPGGVLLVFHFPNKTGWVERLVHALRLDKHFHQRKYDATDIRSLWSSAGLIVEEIGRYNALPRAELSRLPGLVRHSSLFARAYDFIDTIIARTAPAVCTNYYVVARTSVAGG